MEIPLSVKWSRTARKEARAIYAWYKKNMGLSAAEKFLEGIITAIDLLSLNPNMGYSILYNDAYKKQYRLFVEHKNHKIIYYIEKNTIHIFGIWPSSQNPEEIYKRLK